MIQDLSAFGWQLSPVSFTVDPRSTWMIYQKTAILLSPLSNCLDVLAGQSEVPLSGTGLLSDCPQGGITSFLLELNLVSGFGENHSVAVGSYWAQLGGSPTASASVLQGAATPVRALKLHDRGSGICTEAWDTHGHMHTLNYIQTHETCKAYMDAHMQTHGSCTGTWKLIQTHMACIDTHRNIQPHKACKNIWKHTVT